MAGSHGSRSKVRNVGLHKALDMYALALAEVCLCVVCCVLCVVGDASRILMLNFRVLWL